MRIKPLLFKITLIPILYSVSFAQNNDMTTEKCFETADGLEVCVKQKSTNHAGAFTQKDADQLAQSLPKLSGKQLTALQLLLQSQQGQKISSQQVEELANSLPKLPETYLNALALYLQSSQSGTANPKEIEQVLTEVFQIPPQYQSTLQSGLKMIAEKDPSENDIVNLVTQLMKANDVPDEFGNTLQSYFTMINDGDNQKSEEQFMKAGVGLLKFIIKASKENETEETIIATDIQAE